MKCDVTQQLLDGYLDDELDLFKSLEIEEHIATCSVCSQIYQRRKMLQRAIQGSALYRKAPARLYTRIRQEVLQSSRPELPATRRWPRWGHWLLAASLLVVVVILLWQTMYRASAPQVSDALIQDVLADHLRSLQVQHLVDVASSDHHTVKPWFNGKLDYAPVVVDLAKQGFTLVGGRLDYLEQRPVAALVYTSGKHPINLFLWPSTSSGGQLPTPQMVSRQGYHLLFWQKAGMTYCAVSDLEESALMHFAQLIKQQADGNTYLESGN